MSRHPVEGLEDKLPSARAIKEHPRWLDEDRPKPRPLGSALSQAAPLLDPLAEPSVAAAIAAATSEAEERGYRAGTERLEAERAELRSMIDGIAGALERATRRDAELVAELSLALSHGLLDKELEGDIEALAAQVVTALANLPGDAELTIRVHPDDHAGLEGFSSELATLTPEPTLARGEYIIESPSSFTDARLAQRLSPLRAELIDLVRSIPC